MEGAAHCYWQYTELVAKCVGNSLKQSMGLLLVPYQLGYGSRCGVQAIVHAAWVYLRSLQLGQVFVKLDFRNAFNSIRCDKMFAAIDQQAPNILLFVHSASYSSSSFFDKDVIQSAEGVHPGDPLGPFLFCLFIHDLMLQLKSEVLNIQYG